MLSIEKSEEIRKFCDGTRPNECITVFNPVEQEFIFEFGAEKVLGRSLEELNKSSFTRPFEMLNSNDNLIPSSDREIIGILHIAIYSTFFEFKEAFRPLKDYMFCSFRMINVNEEIFRVEKETHTFIEPKSKELLLVDMWRRTDFKSLKQNIEWGPAIFSEKKHIIKSTIKTHIYRNLNIQPFSDREEELLKLIATGKSLKAVGEILFIERNTVKKHLENIKRKLSEKFDKDELSSKNQITNVIRQYGIIDL